MELITPSARHEPHIEPAETISLEAIATDLLAMVQSWRLNKSVDAWPWNEMITSGHASQLYLQGIVHENYQYVLRAPWRQAAGFLGTFGHPLRATFQRFVVDESDHAQLFVEALRRWGCEDWVDAKRRPLPETQLFCEHLRSVAQEGPLVYMAASAVLEVNAEVYHRVGDPYERWADIYGYDPEITAPISRHLREDVEAGHGHALLDAAGLMGTVPLWLARRLYEAAWETFVAQHLWQRGMFEHYQRRSLNPRTAPL